MGKQVLRIGGNYAASFWRFEARYFQDLADAVEGWDVVSMKVDGRALDNAFDVCRKAFNQHETTKLYALGCYGYDYIHSYMYRHSVEMKNACFFVFSGMLSAYLGLE